jgi:hypothetical protein
MPNFTFERLRDMGARMGREIADEILGSGP